MPVTLLILLAYPLRFVKESQIYLNKSNAMQVYFEHFGGTEVVNLVISLIAVSCEVRLRVLPVNPIPA